VVGDLTYPDLLREAVAVSRRIGTWLLHELARESNIDHVIGYLRGRCADFKRRRARAQSKDLQKHYKERISYWKRAIHLSQRMGQRQHQRLARRLIKDIERDLEYREIPYVAGSEVAPDRSDDDGKLDEKPPRGPGKPRLQPLKPLDFRACECCGGEGFFRKTRAS
jgi:hypothetical protein